LFRKLSVFWTGSFLDDTTYKAVLKTLGTVETQAMLGFFPVVSFVIAKYIFTTAESTFWPVLL